MTIFFKSFVYIRNQSLKDSLYTNLKKFHAVSVLVICSTLRAIWTTFVKSFTEFISIFVTSMFQLGHVPILRSFYDIQIFGHLYYFSCHLDHFGDSIFKNHVHFHNQHVRNWYCTNFETILCKINFWSFVPLLVPFGPIWRQYLQKSGPYS